MAAVDFSSSGLTSESDSSIYFSSCVAFLIISASSLSVWTRRRAL